MSAAVGLSYQANPQRLCNFYLAAQQGWAGEGLVALALIVALVWMVALARTGQLSRDLETST